MLTKTSLVDAFYHQRFELGGTMFTATMFSKPRNWSLSQLAHPDEQVRTEFGQKVGKILHDLRVGKAFAPSPVKFTDRIIDPAELTAQVPVGQYLLYRNSEQPADGVSIQGGEAFVVSPSSCPTTVMIGSDGKAVVLHTGRDCLIDRHGLKHSMPTPGRKHPSIIYSALYHLGNPQEVQVKVLWSIPPHLFVHDMEHPEHGATNERMHYVVSTIWGPDSVPLRGKKFWLDLPKLIRDQCMSRGVPEDNIDLKHAYQSPSGTWLNGAPGTGRNLVIVARHS